MATQGFPIVGDDAPEPGDTEGEVHIWLMTQRAVAVARRWNARFPKRQVPIEWVQEAAQALATAEILGASIEALEWQRRAVEFTAKLPVPLLECIWNGRDLPEELP